jgi:hypothetical protein
MTANRLVPVLIIVACLTCFVLMGVPWGSSPPYANFQGCLVYNTGEGRLDISGSYNLYCSQASPSSIHLQVILKGKERLIEINPCTGTFSGQMDVGESNPETVEARLVVDGRILAAGSIHLPSGDTPKVHIIRFSSFS